MIEKNIKDLYDAGTTSAYQIADRLGISYNTVRRYLKILNLDNQSEDKSPKAYYYQRITQRGRLAIETYYIFTSITQASEYIRQRNPNTYSKSYLDKLIRRAIQSAPSEFFDKGNERWTVLGEALEADVDLFNETQENVLDYEPSY